MTHRIPLALLATLVVGSLLDPGTALADRGSVHLRDGSVIRGEVVTYDPGAGVTIQLANGSVIELSSEEIARVEIGSEAPTPAAVAEAAPSADVAPMPAATAAPSPPVLERPGLVGPIVMGSIGVLLVAIGAPMYVNSFCYDCYEFTSRGIAGLSVMGVGGALAISGFGIWMGMRVKARRALANPDGRALRLQPTLGRSHAGLQLSGTF